MKIYPLRYWPVGLLIAIAWLIVQLPHRCRLGIGRIIGYLAYYCLPKLRRITRINLQRCFPKWSEQKHKKMVKQSFQAVGMGLIEAGMAWWLPDWRLKHLVTVGGNEHLTKALKQRKGVIILGLHLTTLEFAGRLSTFYKPFHVMYKKSKNPVIDSFLYRARKRIYKRIIPHNNIRALLSTLAENKIVWYAPDHNISEKRCVQAPFFGTLTATSTAILQIAKLSGAPVLSASYFRKKDGQYRICFYPPLQDFPSGNDENDAALINQQLEIVIRQHPEQYFWLYKRFKKRSRTEKDIYQ